MVPRSICNLIQKLCYQICKLCNCYIDFEEKHWRSSIYSTRLDGSTEGHTSIYNISLNRSTEEGHTSIYNISLQNIIYIFRKELGMPISAPKTKHCAGFNELYTKDSRHIFFQSILNKRTVWNIAACSSSWH